MADIKGINVAAGIVPYTTGDKYATHYAIYGKGGYRTVNTYNELGQIPDERLEDGSLIYVVNEGKIYIYNLSNKSWSVPDNIWVSPATLNAAKNELAEDATTKANAAQNAANTHANNLNTDMSTRVGVLEAIDHEKLAADASATAVATILDGAPEAFDTLKEIAQWISDSETATDAANLVSRVDTLEKRDIYVKSEVDSDIADAKKAGTDVAAALNTYKGEVTQALNGKVDNNTFTNYQSTVTGAISSVIGTAATDATNKANAAQSAASTALNNYKSEVEQALNGKVDNNTFTNYQSTVTGAISSAIGTAATDATNKANAAQSAASTALNNYKSEVTQALNDKVDNSTFTNYQSAVTGAISSAISTAATDATNKANAVKKEAADALNTYKGEVEQALNGKFNSSDIIAINERIEALETIISSLEKLITISDSGVTVDGNVTITGKISSEDGFFQE